MKKMLLSALMLFGFVYMQAQAGKVYINSNCASGGVDYYFYDDQTVIGVCNGCESIPLVQWGSWKIVADEVRLKLTKQWEGEGVGSPVGPCGSVCNYSKYTAKFKVINEEITYSYDDFEDGYEIEGCNSVEQFNEMNPDVNKVLRNGFTGKYAEASERLLTEAELKNLSKQQLKIMRNEIFARYGYIFKTEEMAAYFKKDKNYTPIMENVDAFLSDVEIKNIKLIKNLESK